jgi:murein peptide amidase A
LRLSIEGTGPRNQFVKALQVKTLGTTKNNRNIELHQLTSGKITLLLLGGVHGDEPEGYFLVEKFMNSPELWMELEGRASLYVIPRVNPDGCASGERVNGNGVDLNRNMSTKDWSPVAAKPRYNPGPSPASELESRILMKLIDDLKPDLIISAHSWEPMINYNGPCKRVAEFMSSHCKLRISDDIGYPTPGSLGTWSGWERNIPTITLEIEKDTTEDQIWQTHGISLKETLAFAARGEKLG